ncbi:MAG: 30S ribosome-binding factor RbfA [Anaerolineae bacterium]|nr:30S ribosome-binding factor RbfA [Thermoflexales bacterium]MDW8407994.1 30S ribosome-binding factor RbfA [Anaerolineae bacterium]
MSKKFERRISELVRTCLSTLIETRLKDPRVAGVTVTDVEVTPDTRLARVYYSLIGDDEAKRQATLGLESAAGWLRRELGTFLRTRNTPELIFIFDESLERGERMSQLLDSLQDQSSGHASANSQLGADSADKQS